jgi:uncharacterized SAM-binding protein YcdF (DUF218 family)
MLRNLTRAAWVLSALVSATLLVAVLMTPDDPHPSGDALVVHAGGRGERLETALELMAEGAAGSLVIMDGGEWAEGILLCGRQAPYEVLCPRPTPETTIGEARTLAALVTARGWDEVVIVTSDYHLRRAKYLDSKCAETQVTAAAAPSNLPAPILVARVAKEMAGLVQAVLVRC